MVERRLGTEGNEAFAQISQVGADVESYADGGLAPDTEYCYRVAAFNANGTSNYSNTSLQHLLRYDGTAASAGRLLRYGEP